MIDDALRLPSGRTVARCRADAKAAKRAGQAASYNHALNSISQREMGLNWEKALVVLRKSQHFNPTRVFERQIIEIASEVLGIAVYQQDLISEEQNELIKKAGWSRTESGVVRDAALGWGLIALGHFFRSRKKANNWDRSHPLFSQYLQHWVYTSEGLLAGAPVVKVCLQKFYSMPESLGLTEGNGDWSGHCNPPVMTVADIRTVMDDHHWLTHYGIGTFYNPNDSREERDENLKRNRQELLDAVNECNRACRFMHYIKPRKSIDTGKKSSYGLKHVAERYLRALPGHMDHYIANGSLICAALHMGYRIEPGSMMSPNCYFNFSRRSTILRWEQLREEHERSETQQLHYEELCQELGVS